MGPNEPYWQTNTSFSPPLSRSWDHRFQSEGPPYGASFSSSGKESRILTGGDHVSNHQYYESNGIESDFSSPSDSFQTQQWTPPPMQRVNVDDYVSATIRGPLSRPLSFAQSMEGTSSISYNVGSTSSRSDGSEYETIVKPHLSSHRNLSSCCSFMSKPIHPLSLPNYAFEREARETIVTRNSFDRPPLNERTCEIITTTERDQNGAFNISDFINVSEQLDSVNDAPPYLSQGIKCRLCGRFLLQRSPWGSRRIIRSGDMPVTGVLSCRHVFHAECLEQITPKAHKNDPPCPLCIKPQDNNVPEEHMVSKLRNGVLKDEPSRPWGCRHVEDCVDGALRSNINNTMLSLNRNRLKKHLSLKGNSTKDHAQKLKKIGAYPLQLRDI